MHKYLWVAAIALLIMGSAPRFSAASSWGASYFPNVSLVTHEGKSAHFFDDLIKDKVVVLLDYIKDETPTLQGHTLQGKAGKAIPEAPVTKGPTKLPDSDVVAIMNAWVREAHPGAKVNAGYMTLVNIGPEEVRLVKIESDAFKNIEVHEMTGVDGMMEMHEVTDLVIPAKGQIQFEPGGMHLMLMGPRERLTVGQKVDMTLTFKSGKTQTVSVNVAAR